MPYYSIHESGQAQRSYFHAVILGNTLSSRISGDRTSNLKVLIKFLTGSSSSEAQTRPIPEGVSLESLVLSASPGQVTACRVLESPRAAGPVASG